MARIGAPILVDGRGRFRRLACPVSDPEQASGYEAPTLYTDPVLYDILHAPGTAEEVGALNSIATRFAAGAPDVWLEPACGSGRCLRLAAKQGRSVIGFDLEPDMIRYAQKRSQRAGITDRSAYFVGDMRRFSHELRPESIGLAFNTINTIRHLETDGELLTHLNQTSQVLHPLGVYAVGISLTVYGLEPPSEDIWTARRGSCSLTQIVQYLPPTDPEGDRMESVYSHLTVDRPRGEEHIPSSYALRAYDLEQWRAVIERSALRVVGVVDAAGEPCEPTAPGYAIWVLGRRDGNG